LVFAAAASAQQDDAKTITGRVISLSGQPLPQATVFVWSQIPDSPKVTTTTAKNGTFKLGPLPVAMAQDLYIDAEGFARLYVAAVPTYSRCGSDIGALTLEPGARLRGRVTDADGKPLPEATIEVESWRHLTSGCVGQGGPRRHVRCASDGTFVTPALGAGDHRLHVSALGRVTAQEYETLAPGGPDRDLGRISLESDTPIRGRILAPGGKPIASAEVYCDYDSENTVKTDAEGRFEIRGHSAKGRELFVRASTFMHGQFRLPADHDAVAVEMTVAHQICGRVVDAATGAAVKIGEVRLCSVERRRDGGVDLYG
jgi:hypothetical protein